MRQSCSSSKSIATTPHSRRIGMQSPSRGSGRRPPECSGRSSERDARRSAVPFSALAAGRNACDITVSFSGSRSWCPGVIAAEDLRMRTNANVELDAGTKTFASGLLPDLIAALRRSRKGDLVAVISGDPGIGPELETWCRFTRNSLVGVAFEEGRTRWVLRYGEAPEDLGDDRPVGSRLWLYTNFDCNLSCDYCCVRSSPKAPRRALGIDRVRRIAIEAAELGVREIFVTGGEPFMLPDIGEIVAACAAAAPTTVLTNGMLFAGRQLD